MNISTYLIRLVRSLALAAVVAGSLVAVAQAGPRGQATPAISRAVIPDAFERYVAAHATLAALPDAFERYAVAHPYGRGLVPQASSPVQRIIAQELGRKHDPRLFGPSPAAASAAQPVQAVVPGGFDWGDFGIGIATAVGGLLMLVGLGIGMRRALRAQHRLGSV